MTTTDPMAATFLDALEDSKAVKSFRNILENMTASLSNVYFVKNGLRGNMVWTYM